MNQALAREYGVSRATVYNSRARQPWTEAHVIAVDDLYRKHGGKQLEANHPEVVALARRLGRASTAVAMELINLDKAHSEPGVYPGKHWRFSKLDRKVADR